MAPCHQLMHSDSRQVQVQKILVTETTMRDGIQGLPNILPTCVKVNMVHLLTQAGFQHIEMGSLVRKLPTVADTEQVYQQLNNSITNTYDVLVPNLQGLDRLIKVLNPQKKVRIALFTAASETFAKKNIGCSINESFERFVPVVQRARELQIPIRGYLSCSFDCPYEGPIPLEKVVNLSLRLLSMCDVVVPSDTIGTSTSVRIHHLVQALVKRSGYLDVASRVALHLHGQELDRVDAALDVGIRQFDTGLGNLGGCTILDRAKGNLDTLRFVRHVEAKGFVTGINLTTAEKAQRVLLKYVEKFPQVA